MAKAPSSSRPSVFEIFPDDHQKAADPVDPAIEPTPNDILCGQPKTFAEHPGNLRYQAAIAREAASYHRARTKRDRMQMTSQIVADLQQQPHNRHLAPRARFLQLNSAAQWRELSDPKARDKVSHALREFHKKHCQNLNHGSTGSDESSEEDEGTPSSHPAAIGTLEQHHQRVVSDETFQEAATASVTSNTTDNDHTMRSVDEIRDLLSSLNNSDSINNSNNSNSNNNTITSMDILLDTLRSRDRDEYLSLFDADGGSTLRSRDVSQLLQMDIEEWEDAATNHTVTSLPQLPLFDDEDDNDNSTTTPAVEGSDGTTTAEAAVAAGSRDLRRLFEEPQDDVVMEDGC